jgi:hypothetical protein
MCVSFLGRPSYPLLTQLITLDRQAKLLDEFLEMTVKAAANVLLSQSTIQQGDGTTAINNYLGVSGLPPFKSGGLGRHISQAGAGSGGMGRMNGLGLDEEIASLAEFGEVL